MTNWILILISILGTILLLRLFREPIYQLLLRLRAKLTMGSLRDAIEEADKIKKETGLKCIVLYNRVSRKYEAIPKRSLKNIANKTKVKGQSRQTEGTKRNKKRTKPGVITHQKVKTLQNKSAYVTK